MWEKLQDSQVMSSNVPPGFDDDDEVCAGIRIQPSYQSLITLVVISALFCKMLQAYHDISFFTIPVVFLAEGSLGP
jgi:hypothetical protein